MALLFFQATSVQILRDSILTRVTVRGVHQTKELCIFNVLSYHFLFYIRYYQCVHGKPFEHTCQAGLRWNQALAACDWSSNVQCSSAPMAISTKKSQEDALAESESVADERNSSSVSCSNGLCRSLSSEVQTLGNSASFIVNNPSTTTTTTTTTTEGKFIYLIYKFSFSVVQQNILQKQYKTKFLCS